MYDYETYQDRPDVIRSATPVADDAAARCLSLPVHPYLTEDDVRTIAVAMQRVLGV